MLSREFLSSDWHSSLRSSAHDSGDVFSKHFKNNATREKRFRTKFCLTGSFKSFRGKKLQLSKIR